jgi:hypothetical protein
MVAFGKNLPTIIVPCYLHIHGPAKESQNISKMHLPKTLSIHKWKEDVFSCEIAL